MTDYYRISILKENKKLENPMKDYYRNIFNENSFSNMKIVSLIVVIYLN